MISVQKTHPLTKEESIPYEEVFLSTAVRDLVKEAWEIRASRFPDEIVFACPRATKAVSLTGQRCALNCAHCGGHYLKGMADIGAAEKQQDGQWRSYLVSGGFSRRGHLPLLAHRTEIERLRKVGRLNIHAGLLSVEEVRFLAEVADRVSFDFPGDLRVIKEVYGLTAGTQDYLRSLRLLLTNLGPERVTPHVVLGLDQGRAGREAEAVRLLASEGVRTLVLLVFTPTRGTFYGLLPPPELSQVAKTMAEVRLRFTGEIYLGCMRPGGRYRGALDAIAVECGVNRIVNPTPGATALAAARGLKSIRTEECCVL